MSSTAITLDELTTNHIRFFEDLELFLEALARCSEVLGPSQNRDERVAQAHNLSWRMHACLQGENCPERILAVATLISQLAAELRAANECLSGMAN